MKQRALIGRPSLHQSTHVWVVHILCCTTKSCTGNISGQAKVFGLYLVSALLQAVFRSCVWCRVSPVWVRCSYVATHLSDCRKSKIRMVRLFMKGAGRVDRNRFQRDEMAAQNSVLNAVNSRPR